MLKLGLLAQRMNHASILPGAYSYLSRRLHIAIDFSMIPSPPEALPQTVARLRETLDGFTVTMPYKTDILRYCDALDDTAASCGCANTVWVNGGRLVGYNTDGWGMVTLLKAKGHSIAGKKAVLVGAGGAARAIAHQLALQGATSVTVLNRSQATAEALAARMGGGFVGDGLNGDALLRYAAGAELFINASALGQMGFNDYQDLRFLDGLAPGGVVFDVNYGNPAAKLIRAAREKGLAAFPGKGMSACQGIRAMEIWTGLAFSADTPQGLLEEIQA